MTGPTQQDLHLARPVLVIELDQRLQFPQMMSVAQGMQHVLHHVVRLPVVMHHDANDAGHEAAAVGADPIKGEKSSRGDVQPLGLAAETKAGFVQVLDLGTAHLLAHRIDEALQPIGATAAHPGDGRWNQAHAEEIAHHLGQAVFRQEMAMQEIDDHGANPTPVLYRGRYPCGERCLGSLAALRAGADMGAVLGDHRRTWLGQIKHLARGMTRGHHCRQRRSAAGTAFGIMINHNVRRNDLPQGLTRMSLLPAAGLARWLAQAPGPRRLLQPIARGWLATVAAVEAEAALQFGDLALQALNQLLHRGVLAKEPLDLRFQRSFRFVRRMGPIRRVSHWKLDSRRHPSRQGKSPGTWAVTFAELGFVCGKYRNPRVCDRR